MRSSLLTVLLGDLQRQNSHIQLNLFCTKKGTFSHDHQKKKKKTSPEKLGLCVMASKFKSSARTATDSRAACTREFMSVGPFPMLVDFPGSPEPDVPDDRRLVNIAVDIIDVFAAESPENNNN
jgi:hypothetical protein